MKVGVLGAGAYGLALTHILVNNKVEVTMWTHDENERKNNSQNDGQVFV